MARHNEFRVVVGTDGSTHGRAAVAMTLAFPWPELARVRGVVASGTPALPALASPALGEAFARVAADAERILRRRWPSAEAVVIARPPIEAIVGEAQEAGTVVMGSRGLGRLGRAVLGSVSRGVLRRVACPALIVKQRPRGARVTTLAIGVDGSANARRAVAFVAGLAPAPGSRATLVAAVERPRPQSLGLMPGAVRVALARELAELNAEREAAARKDLEAAAGHLEKAGWTVASTVRFGVPVEELTAAATAARADVLVVGARGTGGVARLLLGSVAEGVIDRCPSSVLLVR